MFNYIFNSNGIVFPYQYGFKKSNMNKYIRTTKVLRKLVISTPLISLAFNGIH